MSQIDTPHRRKNPLTGEWVLVSPHRAKRPWHGSQETVNKETKPEYDPDCFLCPGNTRVSGDVNPDYEYTYVFNNDHPAMLPDIDSDFPESPHKLCEIEPVKGTARVMCFSPRHDQTFADMDLTGISKVIDMWKEQLIDLGKEYQCVQLFENKGSVMGCSMPHPHGQVWASSCLPNEVRKEDQNQREYFNKHNKTLLMDYVEFELKAKERIVVENDDWIVVVPFWAVWPFETMVLPKQQLRQLTELSDSQQANLADALKRILVKYDNLFNVSFPYSMGWHGAPFNGEDNHHWTVHAHFYPPLLRSATVKKFMVGYEMMAEAQRDLTPEQAADRLKGLPDESK